MDIPSELRTQRQENLTKQAYPLSAMQRGMLFESIADHGNGVNIEQMILSLPEALDVPALVQAWQHVTNRHTVLRSRFLWERESEPIQEVLPEVLLPFVESDWRGLAKEVQNVRWEEFLYSDRKQGFTFSEAPLMRITLFRLGDSDYRLVWTFHHVLLDGRSFPLVLEEVFACYEALRRNQELALLPPQPYRAYIDWLQNQNFADAAPFWRQLLSGVTSTTSLGIEHIPLSGAAEIRKEQEKILSAQATAMLHTFAKMHSVTVNTIVQGAWALLMHRYSGDTDIVFGATRACRHSTVTGAETMVGLFINTLPVRTQMVAGMPVREWLQNLRQQHLAVRDFEHTPLDKIQAWSDIALGSPLLQTLFVFENRSMETILRERVPGWNNRSVALREQPGFPLTVTLYLDEKLTAKILYDARCFQESDIVRMLEHYVVLLEGIVAEPDCPISRLPLLTEAERSRLLVEWNDTAADYPQHQCLHQLFEAQVQRTPEEIAVRDHDRTLTYRELNARANQLAHLLQKQGVGPEQRVALCLPRTNQMVVALLAILKAGAAYVALDPAYPTQRLSDTLQGAQPALLITQQSLLPLLPHTHAPLLCLEHQHDALQDQSPLDPLCKTTPADLAYVLFTSGSTGRPKGVAIEHHSPVALVSWAKSVYSPQELARVVCSTSLCFDLSVYEIFVPLCSGGQVLIAENALEIPSLPASWAPTLINTVPSAMGELVRQEGVPASVRTINLAGEALSSSLVDAIYAQTGAQKVYDLYGPSEDTTYSTWTLREREGRATIGRPIANTRLYILDRWGQPVAVGVAGELYIGGAGLAQGYLNRAELTAEKFVPDPFSSAAGARLYRTGDLCRYLSDGNVEYLGRLDHQVKIRGFRIELGEIESVLLQHSGVREAVVLAREDEPGEKRLVAYVVGETGDLSVSVLREHLGQQLPGYMVPSAFLMLEALPLSPNGKVDRKALPAPDGLRSEAGREYVPPRTLREAKLAEIWANVLRVGQVGIYDNFFELGGDSILGLQVISRARQNGISLLPKQIFQQQCIADLLATTTAQTVSAVQTAISGPIQAVPIQQWFFERDLVDPQHYNQFLVLEATEPVHVSALEKVCAALMSHHDMLRLRCLPTEAGWNLTLLAREDHNVFSSRDLSGLSEAEQHREIDRIQGTLDLADGPLVRVVLFDLGPKRPFVLLMTAHHLCIDGVSWRILCEDIENGYRQAQRGEAILLPEKSTSAAFWAERLAQYALSPSLLEETEFWRSQEPTDRLPVDFRDGINTIASEEVVSVSLDEKATDGLLRQVPGAFSARVDEVLIAALAHSLHRWIGGNAVSLDLEGHGREALFDDIDLSRTLGWFTALFPVRLRIDVGASPLQRFHSIRDQLRSIPKRGLGYGVLRYLSAESAGRERFQEVPTPEIIFNYLGQFDQMFPQGALFMARGTGLGLSCSPRHSRAHLIELNCFILEGQLTLNWGFSKDVHRRETVEQLANDMLQTLKGQILECQSPMTAGYVDPDFPELELNHENLDQILAELDF